MRVGRGSDPIGQQMEKSAGMVVVGLGMQVDGRTGGVMVMNAIVRVRLVVWVGEMQFGRRIGGVMVMNIAIIVRLTVWVREMQVRGRTGGVMVMNVTIRVKWMV